MAGKETKMVIKVDLQCHRCYKKIKKILCAIPQVKDQNYDETKNTVTIKVVGGSPENVRQKILYKGRCFVQGVEILPEPKPDTKGKPPPDGKKDGKKDTATKPQDPPQPVLAYPPVYAMAGMNACLPCHNRGCDQFCPCNCHYRRPPMCHDGCGRPAHECGCRRPKCPRCCNRCNEGNPCSSGTPHGCGRNRCNEGNPCSSGTLHGCGRGGPPGCSDGGYCQRDRSCLQM